MTDTAVAHKDYDVRGGGERVAEALAETFDAPLFVGRRGVENEAKHLQDRIQAIDYGPLPTRLAKWFIDRGGATRALAYMLCWQHQIDLTEYDTVILSGNEPLWWVAEDHQTVLTYTHSTPRWQYDLFHDLPGAGARGLLKQGYNFGTRVLYDHNVRRPDLWVANSDLVARRIRQYWNLAAEQVRVVYPPVDTHRYAPDDASTEDFYFHVGRLADHKRVDGIVKTWGDIDAPLKIAGKGPERKRLERLAPDHVEFLGYVSEERKRELMAAARAHVYPAQNEDFGIVPIESMAAGTPVISVDEGFQRYQIRDGVNGVLYDRGDLPAAIRRFESDGVAMDADELATWAEQFGVDRFVTEMHDAVAAARERAAVDASLEWPDLQPSRPGVPADV